jgi:hypothetical protein
MRIRVRVVTALAIAALLYASVASADNDLPPEETKAPKPQGLVVPLSIMGGLRVGGGVNAGMNAPSGATNNPNGAIAAIDLALEVGSTVFDHFYGGLILGGDFFISPQDTTASVSSILFGTQFGYLTNPHGFGGYFGLGLAYRAILVSDANGNALKYDGLDGLFTVGLHVKVGPYLRILPRADLSLGEAGGVVHAIFTFGVSLWLNDEIIRVKPAH